MNEKLYDLMMSYLDMGISVIPVKMILDERTGIKEGKYPAISGWQKYCDTLPDEDEILEWSKIKGVSGIAIVLGKASNLCCIDVDTHDKKLQNKIKEIIPYSPCLIKGNTERLGKYLYRLFDYESDYVKPQVGKEKVKSGKVTVADILYENAYVVIAPSIHSIDETGHKNFYEWDTHDLEKIGLVNLPILEDRKVKDKIDMVVRGMTKSEISKNLPVGAIDLSDNKTVSAEGHRHEDMVSFCASLIAKKTDPTTAISELLHRDIIRNEKDQYFLDKTKGHKYESREINATRFYLGNLEQKNRSKPVSEMEIPTLTTNKVFLQSSEWGEVIPETKGKELPPFNYKWIPDPTIRKFVQDASNATSVAPQNLWFYMLGGFSAITGNKVKIRPYPNNSHYVETCNLYVGIVASSGERKTETTSMALKPLKWVNKMAKEAIKEQNKKNEKISAKIDVKIAKLNKDLKSTIENSEDINDDEDIRELEKQIEEIEKTRPVQKTISLHEQDATIQRLYEIAEENNTGIFIEFNEFGVKWTDLHSRGKEDDKKFLLNGWDGRSTFSYKTKHHGEVLIDELCLATGFSAQYDIMEDIISQLATDKLKADGLLQRYLLFCSDIERNEVIDINFSYPQEIFDLYERAYYIEKSDSPVQLETGAYKVWEDYQNEKIALCKKETNTAIRTSINKYVGLSLRLAGNLEIMKNSGRKPDKISTETMKTAIEIVRYAEEHLRYLFSLSEEKQVDHIVNALKTSVIEDETTVRDLYRHHQGMFGKNATEAMHVLEKLAARNIVKIVKSGKSFLIKINPEIRSL